MRPNYRISQLNREAFARSGRDRASFSRLGYRGYAREREKERRAEKQGNIAVIYKLGARVDA